MRLALDTSAYTKLHKSGDVGLLKALQEADAIALPYVVVAELHAGFYSGNILEKNRQKLQKFLFTTDAKLLFATDETLEIYGKLFAQLRKAGTPINQNDIWIASLCLQYDFVLATADKDFEKIPQLSVLWV